MSRTYPTKVDWWIGLVIAVTVVILAVSAIPFFAANDSVFNIAYGVFCIAVAAWVAAIPFNTNYEITQIELIVRSAGLRWRIPLESITEVVPTYNPLSAPACSLDRLRVNYCRGNGSVWFVLVSPLEKRSFLLDLVSMSPGLEMNGDCLTRRKSTLGA